MIDYYTRMISYYRMKPLVVQAVQVTGELIDAMFEKHGINCTVGGVTYYPYSVEVETTEGTMIGNIGDWIITNLNRERYLCPLDEFQKTYDKIKTEAEEASGG